MTDWLDLQVAYDLARGTYSRYMACDADGICSMEVPQKRARSSALGPTFRRMEEKMAPNAVSGVGPSLFGVQVKDRQPIFGALGARQIARRPIRVREIEGANPMYRTEFPCGSSMHKIPFFPWTSGSTLLNLDPNGTPCRQPTLNNAYTWADADHTQTGLGVIDAAGNPGTLLMHSNLTEFDVLYNVFPEQTAQVPPDSAWTAGEVISVRIPEIGIRGMLSGGTAGPFTCRFLAIQLLDEYEVQDLNNLCVNEGNAQGALPLQAIIANHNNASYYSATDHAYPNINGPLRPGFSYDYYYQISESKLRVKVLADQVFVLPKESADTMQHDTPFSFKYDLGVVQMYPCAYDDSTRAKHRIFGPGRVMWGFFCEQVGSLTDLWNGEANPAAAATANPAWYGTFKMKWRVMDPKN